MLMVSSGQLMPDSQGFAVCSEFVFANMLAVVAGLTMVLTNVITAKAAAVLMFPIATATADVVQVSGLPFVLAVALSAASSLASPIGYQTNLMVYGPGGYRFLDYLRFGGLLSLVVWVVIVMLVPWAWPF